MPVPGSKRAKTGGRTAQVSLELITAAGQRIGLPNLSIQAVASAIGVSGAAIYRHVPSRRELERLVGEAILDELTPADDPADSTVAHLVQFAVQLWDFTLAHPGTARYFQRRFPRGASGTRLLAAEVAALQRRGYDPAAAVVLSGAVAAVTLGHASNEEARVALAATEPEAVELELRDSLAAIAAVPLLQAAHVQLPQVAPADYFRILVTATVEGLVARLPPGRSVAELVADSLG